MPFSWSNFPYLSIISNFLSSSIVSTIVAGFISNREVKKAISNNININKYNVCVNYIGQIDTEFVKKIMLIRKLNQENKNESDDLHLIDLTLSVIYRKLNSEISSIKDQTEKLDKYNSEYRAAIAPADQFNSSKVPSLSDFNKHRFDTCAENLQKEIADLLGV